MSLTRLIRSHHSVDFDTSPFPQDLCFATVQAASRQGEMSVLQRIGSPQARVLASLRIKGRKSQTAAQGSVASTEASHEQRLAARVPQERSGAGPADIQAVVSAGEWVPVQTQLRPRAPPCPALAQPWPSCAPPRFRTLVCPWHGPAFCAR